MSGSNPPFFRNVCWTLLAVPCTMVPFGHFAKRLPSVPGAYWNPYVAVDDAPISELRTNPVMTAPSTAAPYLDTTPDVTQLPNEWPTTTTLLNLGTVMFFL